MIVMGPVRSWVFTEGSGGGTTQASCDTGARQQIKSQHFMGGRETMLNFSILLEV